LKSSRHSNHVILKIDIVYKLSPMEDMFKNLLDLTCLSSKKGKVKTILIVPT